MFLACVKTKQQRHVGTTAGATEAGVPQADAGHAGYTQIADPMPAVPESSSRSRNATHVPAAMAAAAGLAAPLSNVTDDTAAPQPGANPEHPGAPHVADNSKLKLMHYTLSTGLFKSAEDPQVRT